MVDAAAVALIVFLTIGALALLGFCVRKHGWAGVCRGLRALPGRMLGCLRTAASRSSSFAALDGGATTRRRRGMTTAALDQITFVRYRDPVHKFSILHPDTWVVARSENPGASIIVQITCDAEEESYKRLSVAWDDVSWSDISAESFAQAIVSQLPQLVPGSQLVSHGIYNRSSRTDGAYEIVYRLTDTLDNSESQLLNVVVVSSHGGRRRAYTVTFGTDAAVYSQVSRLARHMIDSFMIEDAGAIATRTESDEDGTVHVNVWDRERARMLGAAAHNDRAAALVYAPVVQTAPVAAEVSWAQGSLGPAGLQYVYPALWLSSGLTQDESLGFAPIATHSVRRWSIAYTCDRREHSFKHMSVVCVDVTPCYDLVAARVAKNARALDGTDAGTLLLTYVAYRYRSELLETAAIAAGRPPQAAMLTASEEILRPWSEAFSQRWPVSCRVSTPISQASAADVVAPIQNNVLDQRVVGTSRLWKVAGGLRSVATPATSATADGIQHRGSALSSLSLDAENMHPDGQYIATTSAILFGLHDAVVEVAATARARGVKAAATTARRFFAHIVTFSAASDAYPQYEQLARYVFQHLRTIDG